jgi:hypothetical protein
MFAKPLLRLLALAPLLAALAATTPAATDADPWVVGRQIYMDGRLPDGQPLRGVRVDVGNVTGARAACVNCHRPSGLGMIEGDVAVPPVSGRALFGSGEPVFVRMDRRFNPGLSVPHAPYDDLSFAAAVRDGRNQSGRSMHALMPRYDLSDVQLKAVAAYLKTLSEAWSPGVSDDSIHLATVIAPGVDAQRRQAFITTLTTVVNQMNVNMVSGLRQKISVVERRLHSRRKWTLDFWELSGPRSTWAEQLQHRHEGHPVFAILSGLAHDEWQPVQDFCERNRVGCWFPSVDLVPADAEQSRYSLYFSGGVSTEAEVVAHQLTGREGRIFQLVGDDVVARSAASALQRKLAPPGNPAPPRQLLSVGMTGAGATAIQAALAAVEEGDTLVLWLRPDDLALLGTLSAPAAQVFVSATLAGGELVELPKAWKQRALMVQPLELPNLRAANLERFGAWLVGSNVPLVDRRMQSEVYFAARSLVSTLRGMLNNLHTDYLIERAEATLSMFETMQVQDEIQAMMMSPVSKRLLSQSAVTSAEAAATAKASQVQMDHLDEMRKRGGTTVYPRLSLGQGQRFASKGAYLEKLNPDAPGTLGEADWVVP